MAVSAFVKNNTHGAITLTDGTTPTAETLSVPYDMGDFSVSGLNETLREFTKYETRGSFTSAAHTVKSYPTGSFSAKFTQFTDSSAGTVLDFVLRTGAFSTNKGTIAGDVYTFDIALEIEGTDFGDTPDHSITLTDCKITSADFAEGDPDTIAFSFEVWGNVTLAATTP